MITDIFYILLFVTAFGSIAWLLVMFAQNVLKLILPYSICSVMMLLFVLPAVMPGLLIIAPNELWVDVFIIASNVWAVVVSIFLLIMIINAFVTMLAVKRFPLCTDEKILDSVMDLTKILHMKRLPQVRFGTLKEPACVASMFFPKVILNEHIIRCLTDEELNIVVLHELIHITRKHIVMKRVFDLVCCFHWFNPVCWLARHEFYLSCEMDCDQKAVEMLPKVDLCVYANAMINLIQLSLLRKSKTVKNSGLLDFIKTRRRLASILSPPLREYKIAGIIAALVIFVAVIAFSIAGSRGYFYPYPANQTKSGWSEMSE